MIALGTKKNNFTLHDQHCHTEYSLDSQASFSEYYKIASLNGCRYFVTTEHIEFDSAANHKDWSVDYPKMIEELKSLQLSYPKTSPLLGIEIGYRKDKITNMDEMLARYPFDIVNMSIHDNGVVDYYMKRDFLEHGCRAMLDIYFANMLCGVKNYDNFDVLSHLDYGFKTAYLLDKMIQLDNYERELRDIFKVIIAKNKTLEVNIKVQKNLGTDEYLKYWLELYYQMGGRKLTLTSDSHFIDDYQEYYQLFDYYTKLIKEYGFTYLVYFIKRQEHQYLL